VPPNIRPIQWELVNEGDTAVTMLTEDVGNLNIAGVPRLYSVAREAYPIAVAYNRPNAITVIYAEAAPKGTSYEWGSAEKSIRGSKGEFLTAKTETTIAPPGVFTFVPKNRVGNTAEIEFQSYEGGVAIGNQFRFRSQPSGFEAALPGAWVGTVAVAFSGSVEGDNDVTAEGANLYSADGTRKVCTSETQAWT